MAQSETDLRYQALSEALSSLDPKDVLLQLFARLHYLELPAIQTLFQLADSTGYETISGLFFAMRELLRLKSNPDEVRDRALLRVKALHAAYKRTSYRLIENMGISREEITEDMLYGGELELSLIQMTPIEFRDYLKQEYEDELQRCLDLPQVEQKIIAELRAVQAHTFISPEDFNLLLTLLGIESFEQAALQLRSEIVNDPSVQTLYVARLKQIGGRLSSNWQDNTTINPLYDLDLYKALIEVGYPMQDNSLEMMALAKSLPMNDLLSLIYGGTILGEGLRSAVEVFLDRIVQINSQAKPIAKKIERARKKLEVLLDSPVPDMEAIYEILFPLLLVSAG